MNLNSLVASGAVTQPPSSPALLPRGEGGKLPLPRGDATCLSPVGSGGEEETLIRRGHAIDFEGPTVEIRLNPLGFDGIEYVECVTLEPQSFEFVKSHLGASG